MEGGAAGHGRASRDPCSLSRFLVPPGEHCSATSRVRTAPWGSEPLRTGRPRVPPSVAEAPLPKLPARASQGSVSNARNGSFWTDVAQISRARDRDRTGGTRIQPIATPEWLPVRIRFENLWAGIARTARSPGDLDGQTTGNLATCNLPLAARPGVGHIGPNGAVAEWLKAAVC